MAVEGRGSPIAQKANTRHEHNEWHHEKQDFGNDPATLQEAIDKTHETLGKADARDIIAQVRRTGSTSCGTGSELLEGSLSKG
jgi:uncharacterized protein